MKVAVVLAYNPKNSGMYSVDLAAQRFFRDSAHSYRLYRVLHGRRGPFFMNGQRLHRLRDTSPLKNADAIVYWGDFQNNPLYAVEDFHIREQYYGGGAGDVASSVETWKRFFLLKDDIGARKVISVSNNFQSAGATLGRLDPANASEIADLLGKFDGIYPRDPTSTAEVRNMLGAGHRAKVIDGVDAALLNRVSTTARKVETRKTFVWYFRRSGLTGAEEQRLVAKTAEATGLRPVHLNKWLSLNYLTWDWQFSRMTGEMDQAAFCLSDTYHCLINAMVKGCPVIGIGRQADVQKGTLGDFKKRELFSMFDLGAHYVELTDKALTTDVIDRVVAGAVKFARNEVDPLLYATLDEKVQGYRALLRSELS